MVKCPFCAKSFLDVEVHLRKDVFFWDYYLKDHTPQSILLFRHENLRKYASPFGESIIYYLERLSPEIGRSEQIFAISELVVIISIYLTNPDLSLKDSVYIVEKECGKILHHYQTLGSLIVRILNYNPNLKEAFYEKWEKEKLGRVHRKRKKESFHDFESKKHQKSSFSFRRGNSVDKVINFRDTRINSLKMDNKEITRKIACQAVACLPVQDLFRQIAKQHNLDLEGGLKIIVQIEKHLFKIGKYVQASNIACLAVFLSNPQISFTESCDIFNLAPLSKNILTPKNYLSKYLPPALVDLYRKKWKSLKSPILKKVLKPTTGDLDGDLVVLEEKAIVGFTIENFKVIEQYGQNYLFRKKVYPITDIGLSYLRDCSIKD